MYPIYTQERDPALEHIQEQRATNRWVGALTALIVVLALIVVGALVFGTADDETTDPTTQVTVDVTGGVGS